MIIYPILIPLVFAIITGLFWENQRVKRALSIISTGLLMIVNINIFFVVYREGIQVVQVGDWPAPFGISLVVDLFSAIMLLTTSIVAFLLAFYSVDGIDLARRKYGYFPLFQFLLVGVNGALCTGDLFNLYVWFEVMLMSSFVLIALGGERTQIEGAIKYAGLKYIMSMVRTAVEDTGITAVLHLDHGQNLEVIKSCIDNGFTSVMIDASHLLFEGNLQETREVVEIAHAKGVSVEAELGRLKGVEDIISVSERDAILIDPDEAKRFVGETGIDSLAPAIGTSHGAFKFKGEAKDRKSVV